MITKCPYLINATKLAHQKGLLPKKEILGCKLEGECEQVDCPKLEEPNFRPIFIKKSEVSNEPSQMCKFYAKIERCLRVRRERG